MRSMPPTRSGYKKRPAGSMHTARITSVQLTAEIEQALDERAMELGITRSALVGEIFQQWLQLGRPPFERGFNAGWRAGFNEYMKHMQAAGQEVKRALDNGEIPMLEPE